MPWATGRLPGTRDPLPHLVIDVAGGVQLEVVREDSGLWLHNGLPVWTVVPLREEEREHQRGSLIPEVLAWRPDAGDGPALASKRYLAPGLLLLDWAKCSDRAAQILQQRLGVRVVVEVLPEGAGTCHAGNNAISPAD